MKKIYSETIATTPEWALLQATPFVKNTRLNFNNELEEDFFFNHLYQGKIKSTEKDREKAKEIDEMNDQFDKEVDSALLCLDNQFSRADMLHIAGYGGCGKTTYLRHLIWSRKEKYPNLEYIFTDFEGKRYSYQALLENIDRWLKVDFQNKVRYLNKVVSGQIFSWSRFIDVQPWLLKVAPKLTQLRNRRINSRNYDFAIEIYNIFSDEASNEEFIYFLLVLNFILLLYEGFDNDEMESLVLFFDNIDSIDSQREEAILFSAMKKFVQSCNFFFNENVTSLNEYNGYIVGDVLKKTKVLFLLATRLVTKRRFEELHPDNEKQQGWKSLSMPEHYYDHMSIINRRIRYYEEATEKSKEDIVKNKIENLRKLRDLSNAIYRTNSYKRLFNGNIRYCFDTLVSLNMDYARTGLIDECIMLRKRSASIRAAGDGANGMILALLLDHFKKSGVYEEKLHLSICKKDDKLSLSRLILTFIHDNQDEASMADLYECLGPYYSIEEIARDVFSLSEIKRDVWRRMITFGAEFPDSPKELKEQLEAIKNGERERISELHLCLSGRAYLDFVIPHFEYMLSRHKEASGTMWNYNYQPLFAMSSLDFVNEKAGDDENKYVFERKIKWVFQDVVDCCENSVSFAQKVIEEKGYTRNDYLENSKLNYLSTNNDERSVHQSYESRMIFGHVSYIERYRQYIMAIMGIERNNSKNPELIYEKQIDINRRIIRLIRNYLELYKDNARCYQTVYQTQACKKLLEIVDALEKKQFKDFETIIELN